MRKTEQDFLEFLGSGAYYVLQKRDDFNYEDISIRRRDGRPEEIHNYPYRINQLPAYIFQQFLREGVLEESEQDIEGDRIFQVSERMLRTPPAV